MVAPRFRLLLLAVLLAVGVLAPGIVLPPERAEAQSSRHEIPGIVVDEDGRPIERLFVAASPQGEQGQYERRTTAAGGAFRLWLVEGTYRLSIWSDSHSKCTVSGIENPEGRLEAVFPVEGEGVTPIRIVATTSDHAQQARWVRCYFDVPFYRVGGTVVGPEDEPVEGIDIRLYGLSSHDIRNPWTGKVTGPDGAFAVEVPEGSYRVHLTAKIEDGTACDLGNYGADGRSVSGRDVTRIAVTDEDIAGVVITLTDAPPKLCHEIEVAVTDGGDEPQDGVRFNFFRVLEGATVPHTATTNPGGTFSRKLLGGTYRLYIWSHTYDRCTISGIENPDGRLRAVFSLEGGGASHIDIGVATSERPEAPTWVQCRFDVPSYRVQGTVRGPDQEPLEGIEVRLQGTSGGDVSGPWTAEQTGPDGTFSIDAPAGSYLFELGVGTPSGGVCRLGQFGGDGRRVESGDMARLAVTGEDVSGIAITLPEVPFELCREVQGVVVDAEGEPLAGVSLNFVGHGKSQTPATDEAGTFRVHLRDGDYRLWIRTDLGSDCRIEGYKGAAPVRGNSILVDGEGVRGLQLVLFGGPRSRITNVKCPFPATITTELDPGWNLAGWTGPETSVLEVFEATPQLEAIYSWDWATESFRGAIREEPGSRDSLETLKPGMGVWLRVGGTEGVRWTRPFLTESALVSLADGWNLVSWGGRDGATAAEIFSSLGAEPAVVATWDTSRGQFLRASTAAPAGTHSELKIRRGDALWLQTPERERWLQPGWPKPDVVMFGDSHYHDHDGYLQQVGEAQVFLAERYGVITSDLTFYFASTREALEEGHRQVRGGSPFAGFCATYGSQVIFIATYRCFPVVHEYWHSIQDVLSGNNYFGSPTWIVEGSAFYIDLQHRYSRGTPSWLPGRRFTWATLGTEPTRELLPSLSTGDAMSVGYIAMEWLADKAGEGAIIDYFALQKTSDTWKEAFQKAFGLTVDDFFERFEEHRHEVAPPFEWSVTGTVLDRDSQPVEGINVWVIAYVEGRLASNLLTLTAADGSFAIEHAPGSGYSLLVAHRCADGALHDIGGYGQEGFTTDPRNAPPFAGEDRDRTGLVITLPTTLAEFERDNCGS